MTLSAYRSEHLFLCQGLLISAIYLESDLTLGTATKIIHV